MNLIEKDIDYEKITKKIYEDVKIEEAKRKKFKTKKQDNSNKVKLNFIFKLNFK